MLDFKRVFASAPRKPVLDKMLSLTTPWSAAAANGVRLASSELENADDIGSAGNTGDNTSHENHPHPQFARQNWLSLDGWWDYCIVPRGLAQSLESAPIPATWDGRILVPFSPEATLSGVNRQLKPDELLWYKRSFTCQTYHPEIATSPRHSEIATPPHHPEIATSPRHPEIGCCNAQDLELKASSPDAEPSLGSPQTIVGGHNYNTENRCLLHFEAVDYACICYCNKVLVGSHSGGYLPFVFDITDSLIKGENEILLCVSDPSDHGVQLRGKQRLEHGGIWYQAQSGIWQSVWLEIIPACHITSLQINTQPDERQLHLTIGVYDGANCAEESSGYPLDVQVFAGSELVAQKGAQEWGQAGAQKTAQKWGQAGAQKSAQMHVQKSTQKRAQECSEVGQAGEGEHYDFLYKITMELKSVRLWSPSDPFLYTIVLSYGKDRVSSYCAFRTVRVQADEHGFMRLFLNHKPLFLRGVLDQGYWPDGLMTAPADEALIFDIQAMKDLGFNLLRKHIKIESERWYYHCDRLGMLVWQDMVSGGSPPKPWHISYKPTFFRWSWNHCVDSRRHYDRLGAGDKDYRDEWLQTCADAIRQLGNHPSVIVWGLFNEAWGQFDARQATDMVRKLDPSRPIDATSGWYDQACGDFFSVHNYFRPLEVYKDPACGKRAFVISEFGGLSYHLPEHSSFATSYGYAAYDTDESYQSAVRDTIAQACALEQQGLAGFVYTQLSDIEEETNGILTYDRRMNKLGEGICL